MLPYLAAHYLFTVAISVGVLLLSLVLYTIFAPLPAALQFVIQIPLLVLIVDAFRHAITTHATAFELTESDINASFFFAAPLAAFGASSLFRDIRRLLR